MNNDGNTYNSGVATHLAVMAHCSDKRAATATTARPAKGMSQPSKNIAQPANANMVVWDLTRPHLRCKGNQHISAHHITSSSQHKIYRERVYILLSNRWHTIMYIDHKK